MQGTKPLLHAHISTQAFPEKRRLAMWREVYGRGITNVDIEPIGDTPFHADMTFDILPEVGIASGSRSPAHYRVTRELAKHSSDVVILSILHSGVATTSQFGEELSCAAGSACLLASDSPFTASLHSHGRFTTLALPHRSLAALAPDFTSAFRQSIPGTNPALRLLTQYLDFVCDGDKLAEPDIRRSVSNHILDLAALAIGVRGDFAEIARQRGVKAARLGAIRADILTTLSRGDLSTKMIAARHGITPRYLRKLFEENEMSFSSFVLTERLAKAQRMLMDRRYGHLNIAQIAHENGFGDISYFNRVFRRQFSATPSDVRANSRS
jgi:AraC-like DNA-binding protein